MKIMIVIDSRKERTIKFADVKCGEMFYDPENEMFCMRIQECEWNDGNEPANVIDVADGQLMFYEPHEDVISVKGKVEIYE